MTGSPTVTLVLGAAAGGLAAVAAREAVAATPGLARWVDAAVDPLRRAGREGYAPNVAERRRLGFLGATLLLVGGLMVIGPVAALLMAIAGPAAATASVRARRARYRAAVDRGVSGAAMAIADGLSGGRSLRAALEATPATLEGPAATELSRVRADLMLGTSTSEALAGLRRRANSVRIDSFCAALGSQQLAGGDLAGLLRRFAATAAERDRTAADARSATAQARFTGLLVAAMPAGSAVFAELLEPGFVGGILAMPSAAALLAVAAALQLVGFLAIGRLSRVARDG